MNRRNLSVLKDRIEFVKKEVNYSSFCNINRIGVYFKRKIEEGGMDSSHSVFLFVYKLLICCFLRFRIKNISNDCFKCERQRLFFV